MTRRDTISEEIRQLGEYLTHYVSARAHDSITHLRTIGKHADGYGTDSGEEIRTGSDLTSTERAANKRFVVTNRINRHRTFIAAVYELIKIELDECDQDYRVSQDDPPKDDTLRCCADGQLGKEGAIEWGDPTCLRDVTKAGMCGGHYMDWYRYRRRNGIDTSRDFAA